MCAKGSTVLDFKKQILEDMIEQKVEEAKHMTVNRFAYCNDRALVNCVIPG